MSSANMMTSEQLLISPGKYFMYILNNSGPKTECWGALCLIIFQLEESVIAFISFIFTLCFLSQNIGSKLFKLNLKLII